MSPTQRAAPLDPVPRFTDGRPIPLEPPPPDGPPPPWLAAGGYPADLRLSSEAPEPLLPGESDLGIRLEPAAAGRDELPEHRLVALGDSLTMGFKSLAITDTHLSWPAIVADTLGLKSDRFTYPRFPGPADCPGLPLNLEAVVRAVDAAAAGGMFGLRQIRETHAVIAAVAHVKSYWEHGPGSLPPPASPTYHHNLAIYGWDVRDAYTRSVGGARAALAGPSSGPVTFSPRPSHDGDRAALITLQGPAADPDSVTTVEAARWLGDHGGIDTLVVALGSNNALPSVVQLRLAWSNQANPTVFTPGDFAGDLAGLRDHVARISARRVVWVTVPHVTVAPVARGYGTKPSGSRYFSRYIHAWIPDDEFRPAIHPSLTGQQAWAIDSAIDQYNYSIKRLVYEARTAQPARDWLVLDLCGLLDRLAYRRYLESPDSRPSWWDTKAYRLPAPLATLNPPPDTRFFLSEQSGRTQGGLVALDGVHPTTVGYAILAQEALGVLSHADPELPDQKVDFARWRAADTLVSSPPTSLSGGLGAVKLINELIDTVDVLTGKPPV